ncbi:ATP-binding protein [Croceicoccus ponticola]|uniref:histidine kinase n=1 Tax=Croceicoccus ponticola TaxID=2217664 RepID=A0A437GXY7_9SPHN|nr:ATP-binding protein [Croceicoccus ponticola]RVQ67518.1 ATP-binding protein [Croceicoccus ponticola]
MADGDRLSQVVTNLLSNGVKFSPPGSAIDLSVEWRLRSWRLNIADRGMGIPDEFKPKVFEKFAQADGSNSRKTGGTGLGLSIAREIMLRMGGTIGFADRSGGGTVFCIDILDSQPSRS